MGRNCSWAPPHLQRGPSPSVAWPGSISQPPYFQSHVGLWVTTWEKSDLGSQRFPLSEARWRSSPEAAMFTVGCLQALGGRGRYRVPKLLAPCSAPAPWPQASNSHVCAFTLARKKQVIINSQGCEVLEQEKSSIFEQHLHPAEPTSVMPGQAAGSAMLELHLSGCDPPPSAWRD